MNIGVATLIVLLVVTVCVVMGEPGYRPPDPGIDPEAQRALQERSRRLAEAAILKRREA